MKKSKSSSIKVKNKRQTQVVKNLFVQISIVILFFFSGGTGLIYEVTWTRMLTDVFGNTTYAVSAVLTAFMGGLALGSLVIGRIADRIKNHLELVALLELGVGVCAFLLPVTFENLLTIYKIVYLTFPDSLWFLLLTKIILSFIVLLIPTFLMGGTLPVLSKFFIKSSDQSGKIVSILYALNTLGATIGCFLTGFYFIEYFGVHQTIYISALINAGIAVLFFLLARIKKIKTVASVMNEIKTQEVSESLSNAKYKKIILTSFAIAGFAALSFEVLWTRLLVFKLNTTIYAFSIMLTTFLAGIGLGSLFFGIIEKFRLIKNYIRAFAIIESLIGIYGLISILLFSWIEIISFSWITVFWYEQMLQQLVLAGIIMLFPTILMGIAFPMVSKIYTRDINKIGSSIGDIYSANTFGSILGSFISGFILVQIFGTQISVVFISLLILFVGSFLMWIRPSVVSEEKSKIGFAAAFTSTAWFIAIIFIIFTPSDLLFQYFNIGEKLVDQRVKILYAYEGTECITTVHRYPDGNRVISTGSINVAGTDFTLRTTQKLQAHIPMLLHPHPKRVLQVGFGSGETSHILTTYDTEEVDIVEISRGVLETSAKYFRDLNHDVIYNPKFKAIIMDGANYVALSDRKYDVIMNDSIWPFYAGNSGLYTKEYFEDGKNHLLEGGIMTSWLPVELPEESFKSLLKTFCSVFPHVSLWMAVTHYNKHALLVGSLQPLKIDLDLFLDRYKIYAQKDLAGVNLGNPLFLLDAFKMDQSTINKWLTDAEIHTVDKPVLEFAQRKKRPGFDRERAYELISGGIKPVISSLTYTTMNKTGFKMIQDSLKQIYEATKYLISGLIKREKGLPNYLEDFNLARHFRPDHPGVKYIFDEMEKFNKITKTDILKADFNRLLQLGERFMENNITEKAILAFKHAAETGPKTAIVYYNLGTAYYRAGNFKAALHNLNQAVNLEPEYAPAFNMRGLLYYSQKNPKQSIDDFTRAIEIDPLYAHAYNNRGIVLASVGQLTRALNDFNKAIYLRSNNSEAYFNRGLIYQSGFKQLSMTETEAYEKAIGEYSKAIAIDSTYINAYTNRGMVFAYQEKYQSALDDFNKILDLDPNRAEIYFNRGLIFQMRGDFQAAEHDFIKAIELEPSYQKRLDQLGL